MKARQLSTPEEWRPPGEVQKACVWYIQHLFPVGVRGLFFCPELRWKEITVYKENTSYSVGYELSTLKGENEGRLKDLILLTNK